MHSIMLLSLTIGIFAHQKWLVDAACLADKYSVIAGHTACLTKSPYAEEPRGVSHSIDAIVAHHNRLRASEVTAADMQLMVWDEELAQIAQRWADNCNFKHDIASLRQVPGRYRVGQNLGYGYESWTTAVQAWFDEKRDFTYGNNSLNDFKLVGHYTQVVWAKTSRVGCGLTRCSNPEINGLFFACNYAPAGNGDQWSKPFEISNSGELCEKCPNKCVQKGDNKGLCDCGGLICYNGGTLNLTDCSCKCLMPFHVTPTCDLNCTGTVDSSYCGKDTFKNCIMNVADYCPHMCNLCPYAALDYTPGPTTASISGRLLIPAYWILIAIVILLR